MMPFEGWVNNAVGLLRWTLLPRLGQSLVIWFVAWLVVRLSDHCWQVWLRPTLVGAKDRDVAHALWRRRQILSLPSSVTRWVVWGLAVWLTAELFGVPREALFWGFATATLLVFWSGRYVLVDLAAGYTLLLDDVVAMGDQISTPFGEGAVEGITLFHVHLHLDDETVLVIPHRLLRGAPMKVRRAVAQTVRRGG